jgi:hypothetical protein
MNCLRRGLNLYADSFRVLCAHGPRWRRHRRHAPRYCRLCLCILKCLHAHTHAHAHAHSHTNARVCVRMDTPPTHTHTCVAAASASCFATSALACQTPSSINSAISTASCAVTHILPACPCVCLCVLYSAISTASYRLTIVPASLCLYIYIYHTIYIVLI